MEAVPLLLAFRKRFALMSHFPTEFAREPCERLRSSPVSVTHARHEVGARSGRAHPACWRFAGAGSAAIERSGHFEHRFRMPMAAALHVPAKGSDEASAQAGPKISAANLAHRNVQSQCGAQSLPGGLGRLRELHSQHDSASGSVAGAEHHHRQEASEAPYPSRRAANEQPAAAVLWRARIRRIQPGT
jgi:hypothetical protein